MCCCSLCCFVTHISACVLYASYHVRAPTKACPTLAGALALLIQLVLLRAAVLAYANHLGDLWALIQGGLVDVAAKAGSKSAFSSLGLDWDVSALGLGLQEKANVHETATPI